MIVEVGDRALHESVVKSPSTGSGRTEEEMEKNARRCALLNSFSIRGASAPLQCCSLSRRSTPSPMSFSVPGALSALANSFSIRGASVPCRCPSPSAARQHLVNALRRPRRAQHRRQCPSPSAARSAPSSTPSHFGARQRLPLPSSVRVEPVETLFGFDKDYTSDHARTARNIRASPLEDSQRSPELSRQRVPDRRGRSLSKCPRS